MCKKRSIEREKARDKKEERKREGEDRKSKEKRAKYKTNEERIEKIENFHYQLSD